MEQKIAKQTNSSEGTALSITVITVCWFVLFSPWMRPYVDFWWGVFIFSIMISLLAGHFHPEWTLAIDIDKKNMAIGMILTLILYQICAYGMRWMDGWSSVFHEHLEAVRWINDDPVYFVVALLFLALMGQAEETFWRGYIQQVFSERWNPNVGYALTTIFYTLVYVWTFNWVLILGSFVLSLVWGGLCRINPRWLSPVMVSHSLLNVIAFTLFPL